MWRGGDVDVVWCGCCGSDVDDFAEIHLTVMNSVTQSVHSFVSGRVIRSVN